MEKFGELDVTLWPIENVKPYPKNPRVIPQSAIDKTAASIKQFKWRQPIVVDAEGVIIAGHTRRLAALQLGLKKVPVHVAKDMSEDEARAYRLADNRTADETRWDMGALAEELKALDALDLDLKTLGFDPIELPTLAHEPVEVAAGDVLPLDEVAARTCPHCGGAI